MKFDFKVESLKDQKHIMPEMHYHDFYEIYIQDAGNRENIINNQCYSLNSHDVLLIKPNVLHQAINLELHSRTIIYFTDIFLKKYFSETFCLQIYNLFHSTFFTLSADSYFRISTLVKDLLKEGCYTNSPLTFVRFAEIIIILIENASKCDKQNSDIYNAKKSSTSPIINFINENYLSFTSIDDIANTFYITPSHLCRKFKLLTGCTLTTYINRLRIQHASHLLRTTSLSISDIAEICGFNSIMYFSRTFKALTDLTPSEYRKISCSNTTQKMKTYE